MVGKTALLLIDFQKDFLEDGGRLPVARHQVEPVLHAARSFVTEACLEGVPIFAIGNEFRRNDYLRNFLRHRASIEGSPGAGWDTRLDVGRAIRLSKWDNSAFVNPRLDTLLRELSVTTLAIAGLYAKDCVRATVSDAIARKLEVRLLTTAIACTSDRSRDRAIVQMCKKGARTDLSLLR